MLTNEQRVKLIELFNEYTDAKAHHYYMEDQGSREMEKEAREHLEAADKALEAYLNEITQS